MIVDYDDRGLKINLKDWTAAKQRGKGPYLHSFSSLLPLESYKNITIHCHRNISLYVENHMR